MHPHEELLEKHHSVAPPPPSTLPLIMFRKEGQVCLHFSDNNMFVVEGNFRVFCHQNDRTQFVIFVPATLYLSAFKSLYIQYTYKKCNIMKAFQ
jgi:hypothetical protein